MSPGFTSMISNFSPNAFRSMRFLSPAMVMTMFDFSVDIL